MLRLMLRLNLDCTINNKKGLSQGVGAQVNKTNLAKSEERNAVDRAGVNLTNSLRGRKYLRSVSRVFGIVDMRP